MIFVSVSLITCALSILFTIWRVFFKMSCVSPLTITNFRFDPSAPRAWYNYSPYWQVPCRQCLNCRVDRRNYLQDCCEFEHQRFGCGAFVTLTYDDPHLLGDMFYDEDNKPRVSLQYRDIQGFIDRLRHLIAYNYDKLDTKIKAYERSVNRQSKWSNRVIRKGMTPGKAWIIDRSDDIALLRKMVNRDFRYLYVGEYGGNGTLFDRPHWHIIFFGLSWKFCRGLFEQAWQKGIVDVGYIGSGAVRYVLKYCDKFVTGDLAKRLYDDVGLRRPCLRYSKHLGESLFFEQKDFIFQNNYQYRNVHGKLRPLPQKYKNMWSVHPVSDYNSTVLQMLNLGVKPSSSIAYKLPFSNTISNYSLKQINDYKRIASIARNERLVTMARRDGMPIPVQTYETAPPVRCDKEWHDLIEVAYYGDVVPF